MRQSTTDNAVAKKALLGQQLLHVVIYSENCNLLNSMKYLLDDVNVEICTSSKALMHNCTMEPYPNVILIDGNVDDIKSSSVYEQLMSDPVTQHIPVCCFNQAEDTKPGLNCDNVNFVSEWNDSGRYSENFSKTSAFLFTHT